MLLTILTLFMVHRGWAKNNHTHKSLVLMRVGSRPCRISEPNWKRVGSRPCGISEPNWKLHVIVAILEEVCQGYNRKKSFDNMKVRSMSFQNDREGSMFVLEFPGQVLVIYCFVICERMTEKCHHSHYHYLHHHQILVIK